MTAPISTIDMYNLLREKIGDQQAKTLTDYVTQQVDTTFEKQKYTLASKEDITSLKEDIASLKDNINELKVKISDTKSETIRWVFGFFFALALMVIGIYLRK